MKKTIKIKDFYRFRNHRMISKRGLNLPKENLFIGPATIWKRAAAFVTDLLIINLVVMLPFRPLLQRIIPAELSYYEAYNFFALHPEYSRLISIISIIIAVLTIFYFAILEYKLKQTIGKILMNIYVVSEIKEERFWQYITRSLFMLPLFPFFLLWVIEPIFLFFTKKNQRLTEILSKTRVIENYTVQ